MIMFVKIDTNVKHAIKIITNLIENAFLNVQVIHFYKLQFLKAAKFMIKIV